MRYFFVLFIVMPILEMWVLIQVGSMYGALTTIALVLLTAIVGLALLKHQGFSTLRRAQHKLSSGQIPALEMVESLFFVVGGALLLTPGFITDSVGFCLLIPNIRQQIARFALTHFSGQVSVSGLSGQFRSGPTRSGGNTFEGDFSHEPRKNLSDEQDRS